MLLQTLVEKPFNAQFPVKEEAALEVCHPHFDPEVVPDLDTCLEALLGCADDASLSAAERDKCHTLLWKFGKAPDQGQMAVMRAVLMTPTNHDTAHATPKTCPSTKLTVAHALATIASPAAQALLADFIASYEHDNDSGWCVRACFV